MNVRFTNRAENDVAKISDFPIGQSPKSGQSVAASLFESIPSLRIIRWVVREPAGRMSL
jgi:hypothetical protein